MRSGTSMMMRALEAGGMEACYRASRDVMKNRYTDEHYDPNPTGLYELERKDYAHPEFPRMYAGKLIKALQMGPAHMRAMEGGIRVVFMLRDPEEQRQSYMAFFGGQAPTADQIAQRVERALEAAKNRRDTTVMEIEYSYAISNPRHTFLRVASFFGVDLDIDKATAVVEPVYYRFRREELEVGIV
jgi:hypothetical protein